MSLFLLEHVLFVWGENSNTNLEGLPDGTGRTKAVMRTITGGNARRSTVMISLGRQRAAAESQPAARQATPGPPWLPWCRLCTASPKTLPRVRILLMQCQTL